MSFRDTILQNVLNNQPSARELPAVPKFHSGQPVDLKREFTAALKELSGEVVTEPPADFEEFLRKRFPDAKTICSAVPEYAGNRVPEDFVRWSDASSIDVTIVRSPLGVAETGSVLLSEEEFRVNTIGFLAHDIVILLDPAEIVENIHDAYSHPHFLEKAYSLLMSGPSGSADIGGITVHPAQGVMTLTVIFWPRTARNYANRLDFSYLYGWNRVSPVLHWLAGIVVAVSGVLSAVFVVWANCWQQPI
jgi:L-lactate dehydrogenase complex protein LldG